MGYLLRPYVGDYTDADALARAASAAPGRWLAGSLLVSLGFAGLAVAVHWVATAHAAGTWPALVAPATATVAAVLLAFQLGGTTAATVSAAGAGADPVAVFAEARSWEGPLITVVLLAFVIAWASVARAVGTSHRLNRREGRIFAGAAVVAGVGLFVPSSLGEYLSGLALVTGFWLLSVRLPVRPTTLCPTAAPAA